MLSPQIVDKLRTMLHQIFPEAKDVSGNTQITINCPLCAQSGDPDYGGHMYINLGLGDKPPMFNCFRRTGHSGLLTKSTLEQLSNYSQYIDTELLNEIEKSVSVNSKFSGYRVNRDKVYNVSIPNQVFSNFYNKNSQEFYEMKRRYMSERIGIEFTHEMLRKNKIVLGLFDFLNYNHVDRLTLDGRICKILDQYYIGFLTNTNAALIMRNIIQDPTKIPNHTKYHEMRYVKYSINPMASTSYYIIPTSTDILLPVDIYIAEGTFDILSVFYNLQAGCRKNKIYAAIGSKAYMNLIKFILINYGLIMMRLHIYIDTGIEKEILEEIKYHLDPLEIPVYIHINTFHGEKDFGVPKERISDYMYKL